MATHGLFTLSKGCLDCNKDMQEDKEALFDGADTVAIASKSWAGFSVRSI